MRWLRQIDSLWLLSRGALFCLRGGGPSSSQAAGRQHGTSARQRGSSRPNSHLERGERERGTQSLVHLRLHHLQRLTPHTHTHTPSPLASSGSGETNCLNVAPVCASARDAVAPLLGQGGKTKANLARGGGERSRGRHAARFANPPMPPAPTSACEDSRRPAASGQRPTGRAVQRAPGSARARGAAGSRGSGGNRGHAAAGLQQQQQAIRGQASSRGP